MSEQEMLDFFNSYFNGRVIGCTAVVQVFTEDGTSNWIILQGGEHHQSFTACATAGMLLHAMGSDLVSNRVIDIED